MSESPFESSSGLNFGVITFAGSLVHSTHFLAANADVSTITDQERHRHLVGNSFIVGVPMRLFRITCQKNIGMPVNLRLFRNNEADDIAVQPNVFQQELGGNYLLVRGDRLQVRVTHAIPVQAPPRLSVSLYFFALPEALSRQILPAVNILTFAGYNSTARVVNRLLRFKGSLHRETNTDLNDSENYCVVGSNMIIYRLTWHKNVNSAIEITIGGTNPNTIQSAVGVAGVLDITPYAVNLGDVVRVNCSMNTGPCVISLYATPGLNKIPS